MLEFNYFQHPCPVVEDNLKGVKAFPGSIAPLRHVGKISRVALRPDTPGTPGQLSTSKF